VAETTAALREWNAILRQKFLEQVPENIQRLFGVSDLILWGAAEQSQWQRQSAEKYRKNLWCQ
jgi:hypothetical protein